MTFKYHLEMVPSLFCCSVIWDVLQQLPFVWLPSTIVALLKLWKLHFYAALQCDVFRSPPACNPALGMSLAHSGVTKVLCRVDRGKPVSPFLHEV